MRYDRKIKYLDYCENGERIRGGGFLKTEISQDFFKVELTVRGVRCAGESVGDVLLCGADREEVLGKIQLAGGQGEFRHICHIDAENGGVIGNTGILYDELSGIRIPLGEGREITCMWNSSNPIAGPSPVQPTAQQSVKPSPGQSSAQQSSAERSVKTSAEPLASPVKQHQERSGRNDNGRHISHREEVGQHPAGKEQEVREAEATHQKETVQDIRETAERNQERKVRDLREAATHRGQSPLPNPAEEQEAVPLLENKWLQLCAIYPHINPFRDQREYLSIGPEDFVLFSSESYKAAGNSFMLHGYYNYHHLILAREERRGETVYYVGVPGNYYDREKQVAIMFGFESFECAQEPAQSSDFGYYMMRVQL